MLKPLLALAALTLGLAAHAQTVTDIAPLHTLLDPVNYLPTDTTTLFTVEGVVTTHTNLTTVGNALFYIHDATAGIAVFVSGGSTIRPAAGDRVRVTGPLGHFNGLLELNLRATDAAHSVTVLSSDNPLPTPAPLEFAWQNDPAVIEPREGSYVVAANVTLDLSTPTFGSGANVNITNEAGEVFVLRIDARTDIGGQVKPTGPVTIYGVLGQFDTANPRTEGYQLIPSRFADIISASKAPTVRFTNLVENLVRLGDLPTNSYSELVLQPGERLSIQAAITDPEGRVVTITAPTQGLPAGATWTVPQTTGTELQAAFRYTATTADAGKAYTVHLLAANNVATNDTTWTLYIPTAAEQRVFIGEFLANPANTNTAAHFNPLRRTLPDPLPPTDQYNPSTHDEFVELVNLSDTTLDLLGWTIADAVQVRHRFYEALALTSSNAVIVFGGPLNGFAPNLDVPSVPASENAFGFGLNNSGGDSLIVRNANANIVARLVFTDRVVSATGSTTRFPDLNGALVQQVWVSAHSTSPGRQYDGRSFGEPAAQLESIAGVGVSVAGDGSVALGWTADPARSYTVWSADELTARFLGVFYGLRFQDTAGQFTDKTAAGVPRRFYWISSP